jgi:hypothetical protein
MILTPTLKTYTIDITKQSQMAKGVYCLINYDRTTTSGTETGIELYQLYKFNGDTEFRYREYLDANNTRQKCVDKITGALSNVFMALPVMASCDKIKIQVQFTGYSAGNYGRVEIDSVQDVYETP